MAGAGHEGDVDGARMGIGDWTGGSEHWRIHYRVGSLDGVRTLFVSLRASIRRRRSLLGNRQLLSATNHFQKLVAVAMRIHFCGLMSDFQYGIVAGLTFVFRVTKQHAE